MPALALLLFALAAASQAEAVPLFVSSSPLRATVFVDGIPLAELTPVLLRDLPPGRHEVLLRKDGCADLPLEVSLVEGEVGALAPSLYPSGVELAIGGATEVGLAGATLPGSARFVLPPGTYRVNRAGGKVLFDPVYPGDKAIRALDLLVPVCAVLAGLSTTQDILYRQGSSHFFSPLTLSSYALTVGALGVDIALRVGRSRWRRTLPVVAPQELPAETEGAVRGRADGALERGLLDEAAAAYLRHMELYPESPSLPSSLYQIGRIYQMRGEPGLAAGSFRLLLTRYPLPELYDRASRSLAEVRASTGDYAAALETLAGMVMIDPLYTPEEVQAYGCELLDTWAEREEAKRGEAVEARRELVRLRLGSPRIAEYRYQLARALWRAGEGEEALAEAYRARDGAPADLAQRIAELEAEIGGGK